MFLKNLLLIFIWHMLPNTGYRFGYCMIVFFYLETTIDNVDFELWKEKIQMN